MPDRSFPVRMQGKVLGSRWSKVMQHIPPKDQPPTNFKLASDGGRLHLLLGQRTLALFISKVSSFDDQLSLQPAT